VLSEPSELSKLSELIELPEVFSSMKKCLFHGALRPGDPLIKLLELRFVSLSSETSRSFQTSQSSQSSITSHSAFPDVVSTSCLSPTMQNAIRAKQQHSRRAELHKAVVQAPDSDGQIPVSGNSTKRIHDPGMSSQIYTMDSRVSEYGTLKAWASCTKCGTHSPGGEPFTNITKWVVQPVFIPPSSDIPCIIYSSQCCL